MENSCTTDKKTEAQKLKRAKKILLELQKELPTYIANGSGPFLAAVYDAEGHLISKEANSVVLRQRSHRHAEMNAIKMAEKTLNTYDLSPYNLVLYSTAEPCMMCLGGILWSGIKEIYYGVPSNVVEEVTGFDEGFKPDWQEAFRQRGIIVHGPIEEDAGKKVLQAYVAQNGVFYGPKKD